MQTELVMQTDTPLIASFQHLLSWFCSSMLGWSILVLWNEKLLNLKLMTMSHLKKKRFSELGVTTTKNCHHSCIAIHFVFRVFMMINNEFFMVRFNQFIHVLMQNTNLTKHGIQQFLLLFCSDDKLWVNKTSVYFC